MVRHGRRSNPMMGLFRSYNQLATVSFPQLSRIQPESAMDA